MTQSRIKIEFPGHDGTKLSGLLEVPESKTQAYALFAHCFTCSKNIAAATRISRALKGNGIAVLRFDFTGLGNSDGDFANTNFSSNVQDLLAATDYLREHYQAPALLIGHSLGGAAVLKAALDIPEAVGVVTIGAPFGAEHVMKQFKGQADEIEANGVAEVDLAGRKFTIQKQFLDDLKSQNTSGIAQLKKALLIFHSPVDQTVSINEAEKIYVAAKHPKSFISLDNADHLLSHKEDAAYVADNISAWAKRYLTEHNILSSVESNVSAGNVVIDEKNHEFTRKVTTDAHQWLADEPTSVGGRNLGPDPYEHLLAALGTCTSMTIRMYANLKKIPLDDVSVELSHSREHGDDCKACDEEHQKIDVIERRISLKGNLTDEDKQKLLVIADKCPVHKTLHNKLLIQSVIS
ncbi:MAG: osmotically inducible protein C [Piscirickettsiaceae bacterium]|nr:MAG: osmotically inducible protein C [Piscirickettsiaceae bacterium]